MYVKWVTTGFVNIEKCDIIWCVGILKKMVPQSIDEYVLRI